VLAKSIALPWAHRDIPHEIKTKESIYSLDSVSQCNAMSLSLHLRSIDPPPLRRRLAFVVDEADLLDGNRRAHLTGWCALSAFAIAFACRE